MPTLPQTADELRADVTNRYAVRLWGTLDVMVNASILDAENIAKAVVAPQVIRGIPRYQPALGHVIDFDCDGSWIGAHDEYCLESSPTELRIAALKHAIEYALPRMSRGDAEATKLIARM